MKKLFTLRFCILLAVLVLCPIAIQAQTKVHYVNVGQADAILLEFDKAAVMIDAGGEATNDSEEQNHLINYLNAFFQRRTDLNRTIHTIIISHPHIDHTMKLLDVVRTFKVLNLIDGGNTSGSGIEPLRRARQFVSAHGGHYFPVNDDDVTELGFKNPALDSLNQLDHDVTIRLLSGSRGCTNANNDSLVVLASYKATRFIFTGDAEAEGDDTCGDEISELISRAGNNALHADVYKADHHGSANGTTEEWMRAISPKISIISAGKNDAAHQIPGKFHAFQFGHPRESVVKIIEANTSTKRDTAVTVTTMDKVRAVHNNRRIENAVYCTCWDGNIVVEPKADGSTPTVKTQQ